LTNKIYIRADGNTQIGLGHLVRCMALADMLRDHFQISFVVKSITENLAKEIINKNFDIIYISDEKEILTFLNYADIVVIDHYDLGIEYHKLLKSKKAKVVCIDDIYDKSFEADLIINHAPGVSDSNYVTLNNDTKFVLGIEYALLRSKFLEKAKQQTIKKNNFSVFVNFGGSDNLNISEKVVDKLLEFNSINKIILVVGAANSKSNFLKNKYLLNEKVNIYYALNEDQMIEMMEECFFAIVPSSGILFEVLALGCYTFSTTYVDNQDSIFNGFKSENMIFPLKSFIDLDEEIFMDQDVVNNFPLKMNSIDGYSGERLLNLFKTL